MDKYTQLKKFQHDLRLKVYMYAFMHVYPETILVEDHFPAIKKYVENYRKCQLQDHSQKIGLDLVTYVQKIMS